MMPVVLLEIDGQNNASPALGTVLRELGDIEQAARKLNNAFPTATRVTNFGKAIDALKGQVGNLPAEFTTLASTADAALNQVIAKFRDVEAAITAVQTKTRAAAGDIVAMGTAAGKLNTAFPTATRVTNFEQAILALQGKIGTLPTEFTDLALAADTALGAIIGKFGQVEAAIGAVTAAIKVQAQAYGQLAGTMKGLPTPPPPPSTGTGTTSTSGGHGGATGLLRNFALYGLGYGGAYAAYNQVQQSLGRDVSYSQLLGSTAAMTGLSPQQASKLSDLTRQQAGSGNYPYSAQTLLQGSYSVASLGIGNNDPTKIAAVNAIIAKLSTAAGAPDTTTAGDTITTLLAAYGLNNRNVVANTQQLANQLQVGVKLGKIDMPTFAIQAGGALAAQAHLSRVSSADIIAALAAESAGGNAPGELGQDTFSLLRGAAKPSAMQRNESRALGLQYNDAFWGKYGIAGGSDVIAQHLQAHGITGTMQLPVLQNLLGDQTAVKAFLTMQSGNIQGFAPQVADSRGAAQHAYEVSQTYQGNKLADAEAKLSTAFDNLTIQALPTLTAAALAAAGALNGMASVFAGPGGKGGLGASVTGAFSTLGFLLNPKSPDFMNIDKARIDAARQMQSTQQAQTDAMKGLNAPLTKGGMALVGAAPGSALYNQYGSHPYSAQEYAQYGSPAQQQAYGRFTTTRVPNLSTYGMGFGGMETQLVPLGLSGMAGPQGAQNGPQTHYTAGSTSALFSQGAAAQQPIQTVSALAWLAGMTGGMGAQRARPGALDNYTYTGPMGKDSAAYQLTQITNRGGANPQVPAVRDALLTLKDDITQKMSKSVIDAALASYEKAVRATAVLSPTQQRHDIVAAQKLVDTYEGRGTAVSRIPKQLPTAQPGPGALLAGNENTAVRFAGQQDPLVLENRQLRRELDQANNRIAALLTEIRDGVKAWTSNSPNRPNPQKSYGARGTKH